MIYHARRGQDVFGIPAGIIIMDCFIPYPPGSPGNAASFDFPVMYSMLPGIDMDKVVYNPDTSVIDRFIAAGEELVAQGCKVVFGNCGFMVLFQEEMAKALPVPVFMSSLLQLPLIRHGLTPGQKVGIISASGTSLTQRHLEAASPGAPVDVVIRGLEHAPAFKAAIHDQVGTLDFEAVREEVVATAREMVREEPQIGAFLLECTDLPPYASAIQTATGLPVFDVSTMINYATASVTRRPFAG